MINFCIPIQSIDDPRVAEFRQNKEGQLKHMLEPEPGYFIAESALVIGRALDAGYEPVKFLREAGPIRHDEEDLMARIADLQNPQACSDTTITSGAPVLSPAIPVYEAQPEQFEQLTGFQLTRGLLCLLKRTPVMPLTAILSNPAFHRIVILDDVENPTNVGAIIRSAAALSMDAVILTGGSSDPLYRRAVRVGMGCVFRIPWTTCEASELYPALRAHGYRTAAMALSTNSIPIDDPTLNQEDRLAIVMGNEGYGLPQATIDTCDHTVLIPMAEGVDSLNVAAASAVAFWQLRR